MKIFLRDINGLVTEAWVREFSGIADVEVEHGDIFSSPVDCVVSPANSFGWMDGGIDLVYMQRMGVQIQSTVQNAIAWCGPFAELLVGQALHVETGFAPCPNMIVAPTMRTPRATTAENVFLATRAALHLAQEKRFKSVAMPGMGTWSGRVPPADAAIAMREAYEATAKELIS